ncbi:MAG TPA: D-alanine--D-alanine ligase [Mycobacteriales bacterium]|nr:D-alanine--D-alanine ligase [Mycobacteriales bacterium]
MTYLILAGGLSPERDVSLRSGRRVSDALHERGIDAELRDPDGDLLAMLRATSYAACLPLLHGAAGEDGSLRTVLDLVGVPYVGSGPAACRLAWDKPTAKAVARRTGLSTPEGVTLPQSVFSDLGAPAVLEAVVARLGLPLMVKPASGGSAMGCTKVTDAADLPAAMVACFSYGDTVLLERFISGVEVAVTVLDLGEGPRALPAVEVRALSGVYDYTARYSPGHTEYFTPARLPDPESVSAAAVTAHVALGLRDVSRADLVVSPDGVVHLLEVNVSPGMTETSLLPMAVEADGGDLGGVLASLLERAAARRL